MGLVEAIEAVGSFCNTENQINQELVMSGTISNEQALIYVMVMMSGVEGNIRPEELAEIDILVRTLPVFKNFDRSRLATVAQEAGDMLQVNDGMATVLGTR